MNGNDTFPRRNLPVDADPWGQVIEAAVYEIQYLRSTLRQDLTGQNRSTASTAAEMARQIERIDLLRRAIPLIDQATATTANFDIGSGWNNICSATLTVPQDMTRASITGVSSGVLRSTTSNSNIEVLTRLELNGDASIAIPGSWSIGVGIFNNSVAPSHAWDLAVTPGQTLTVNLQVNPTDPASWSPGTGSEVTVSAIATFTAQ